MVEGKTYIDEAWSGRTSGQENGICDTCWASLPSHWLVLTVSQTARIDGSLLDVDFFVPRVRVYLISLIAVQWFRTGHNITALHIEQSMMIHALSCFSRVCTVYITDELH